jgi:hypothetical protein
MGRRNIAINTFKKKGWNGGPWQPTRSGDGIETKVVIIGRAIIHSFVHSFIVHITLHTQFHTYYKKDLIKGMKQCKPYMTI